jgi:hypothetical protein
MTVAEDFVLLTLNEVDGSWLVGNVHLECGVAAAVLVELVEAGRITVDSDAVVVRDAAPTGLVTQDVALARIAAQDVHDPQWWVSALRRGAAESVLAQLVACGAVTEQRVRWLVFFSQLRHPPVDPAVRRLVRERLCAVLAGGPADVRDLALLAIVHATGLSSTLFPGTDPADIERLIDEAGEGPVADALVKVIRQVLAAVLALLAASAAAM